MLRGVVEKWLAGKGASSGLSGTYEPLDGSAGSFATQAAGSAEGSWWMLRLDEETEDGRRFSTAISITSTAERVSVYVTLETGWTTARIMPVSVDPRCPKVVRDLLSLPGHWYHGASTIRQLRGVSGFDDGEALAAEIQHPERSIPIVAVTLHQGEPALPELATKLAYDLAGVANVVVVDQEASWALTDVLGYSFCCHSGGIRLYWPHFSLGHDRYRHPLWTPERLWSRGTDLFETRERFRLQLRGLMFRAAALSVTRPHQIDEIRDAGGRSALSELRARANSMTEYQEIADSYAMENDQLRGERQRLRSQIEQLAEQVAKLEADREALLSHLHARGAPADENAERMLDIPPDSPGGPGIADLPTPGETRFYKKVHARSTHDVMVRVADCGCNNWEGAHSADKARKGIAKLEGGRTDWKTMQHCASCTGGGMWRVRW